MYVKAVITQKTHQMPHAWIGLMLWIMRGVMNVLIAMMIVTTWVAIMKIPAIMIVKPMSADVVMIFVVSVMMDVEKIIHVMTYVMQMNVPVMVAIIPHV
jgi:hypothetical protein